MTVATQQYCPHCGAQAATGFAFCGGTDCVSVNVLGGQHYCQLCNAPTQGQDYYCGGRECLYEPQISGGGEVINLTPHSVTIEIPDEGPIIFPPSGTVARIKVENLELPPLIGPITGRECPVRKSVFGTPEGVPAPRHGVVYITSTLVAQQLRRPDVLSPDTGPSAIRENGQVVAVRALQSFA